MILLCLISTQTLVTNDKVDQYRHYKGGIACYFAWFLHNKLGICTPLFFSSKWKGRGPCHASRKKWRTHSDIVLKTGPDHWLNRSLHRSVKRTGPAPPLNRIKQAKPAGFQRNRWTGAVLAKPPVHYLFQKYHLFELLLYEKCRDKFGNSRNWQLAVPVDPIPIQAVERHSLCPPSPLRRGATMDASVSLAAAWDEAARATGCRSIPQQHLPPRPATPLDFAATCLGATAAPLVPRLCQRPSCLHRLFPVLLFCFSHTGCQPQLFCISWKPVQFGFLPPVYLISMRIILYSGHVKMSQS
jgi:hypothetical protein